MNRTHATCLSLFALALTALSSVSARAAEAEWVSLFDGKTLSGWKSWTTSGHPGGHWAVQDGCIAGSGNSSMLYSPKSYKNFKFRAELKISDGGNSGMYFRCPKPNGSFGEGYEAQVDSTHRDPIRTGSLYTFVHIYDQIVPPDTWFTYEIQCVNREYRGSVIPQIKVTINGKLLYEFLDHSNSWKEGHFAFQQHDPGSHVHIRKIEVQELP
ncbi:MAG: 3-keto-disaccharide hydrolase [Isosphaeraceae bacterium]